MASRAQPYDVHRLKYNEIFDLKKLKENLIQGRLSTISWLKIKQIKVEKKNPEIIFVKTSYDPDEEYMALEASAPQTTKKNSSKKKNKKKSNSEKNQVPILVPKYKAQLPISKAKKKDLITLCEQKVIPEDYHQFYRDLPCDEAVKEKLAEPDDDEEEVEEDEEDKGAD